MNTALITDSASDISIMNHENITVVPLKIRFGQDEYEDGVNLSHDQFYEKLEAGLDFPKTSQPSPFEFARAIEEAKANGAEDIILITMSSKLSGTYQSACLAAAEYDHVYVIDSKNVTLGEMVLVERARQLIEQNISADEIAHRLNREKEDIHLVAAVDTLEYLKRGGRISSMAVAAGSMLHVKPILGIEDGKIVTYGKARGQKKASAMLNNQIQKLGGIYYEKPYFVGFTQNRQQAQQYIEESKELLHQDLTTMEPISVGATIGTHTGPGIWMTAFFGPEHH